MFIAQKRNGSSPDAAPGADKTEFVTQDRSASANAQRKRQALVNDATPGLPTIQAILSGQNAIQRAVAKPGPPEKGEFTANGDKVEFCKANNISMDKGDTVEFGSTTAGMTAPWKNILHVSTSGNVATMLHIVNAEWGGSGNPADFNVMPGTPGLNGHHKVQENIFRSYLTGGVANEKIAWRCYMGNPDHFKGRKSGDVFDDPALKVDITAAGKTTSYPVEPGSAKLLAKTDIT